MIYDDCLLDSRLRGRSPAEMAPQRDTNGRGAVAVSRKEPKERPKERVSRPVNPAGSSLLRHGLETEATCDRARAMRGLHVCYGKLFLFSVGGTTYY